MKLHLMTIGIIALVVLLLVAACTFPKAAMLVCITAGLLGFASIVYSGIYMAVWSAWG